MRRTTTVTSVLVVAALAASAALAGVAAEHRGLKWEVEESNRNDRAADGQSNNLDATPIEEPTRILDSVYMSHSTFANIAGPRYTVNALAENELIEGDVILPGAGHFFAWYGFWLDINGDGVLNYNATCQAAICTAGPANEFGATSNGSLAGMADVGPTPGATIVAFVDPGSHPTVDSNSNPKPMQPDFYYSFFAWDTIPAEYLDRGYPAIYVDGSLLQPYRVVTMANGQLVPDPETERPFTCPDDGRCLVDVDVYPAVAAPIAGVYATTGAPVVNSLPAISAWPVNSLAHDTGSWLPAETHEEVGPVFSKITPGYTLEYLDPGSSAHETTLAGYQEEYHAWIDARGDWLQTGFVSQSYNLFGFGGPEGEDQSAAPGVFSISANLGVWRDINGDGVIGAARDPEHPYAHGTKADPMDYGTDTAEWFGWFPSASCEDVDNPAINATVWPTGPSGWGPAGVLVIDYYANDPSIWYQAFDFEPIHMPVLCYNADPNLGAFYGYHALVFPAGNAETPFSFKLSPIAVRYTSNGVDVDELAWDEDAIAAFNPQP